MAEQVHHSPEWYTQDRRPTLLGVFWVLATLSTLCTLARLYARFRLVRSPGWDDAVVAFSMVPFSFVIL